MTSGNSSVGRLHQLASTAYHSRQGGIVFASPSGAAIAMEFFGPAANGGIQLEYVMANSVIAAENFLRGETFDTHQVDSLANLLRHLTPNCARTGRIDIGSGCHMFAGIFKGPKS